MPILGYVEQFLGKKSEQESQPPEHQHADDQDLLGNQEVLDRASSSPPSAPGDAPPVDEAHAPEQTFNYTCDGTETYSSLAKRGGGGGDWRVLRELNPEQDERRLSKGTTIRLPVAWAGPLGVELQQEPSFNPDYEVLVVLLRAENFDEEQADRLLRLVDKLSEEEVETLRRDHAEGFERLMRATGQVPEDSGFLGGAWETLERAWEQAGGMVEGAGEQVQSWGESLRGATAPWWADEIGEEVEEEQGLEQVEQEDAADLVGLDEREARLKKRRESFAESFGKYQEIELTVEIDGVPTKVTVSAKYKIFQSRFKDDTPYQTAIDYRHRGDGYGSAFAGKASSEQLAEGLQSAIDRGEMASALKEAKTVEEAASIIEKGAHKHLGVDCSGFVWNLLRESEESAEHVAVSGYGAAKSTTAILEGGGDLTTSPESWQTGDLIFTSGSGGNGHVAIIYDVSTRVDGNLRVQVMESAGSSGVQEDVYVYVMDGSGRWLYESSSKAVTWIKAHTVIGRPKPFMDEDVESTSPST